MNLAEHFRGAVRSLADKGFFHMLGALAGGQGLALIQRLLLGRLLSVASFGRFALLVESMNFLGSLLTLGLPTALMRFAIREGRVAFHLAGTIRV